MAGETSFPRYRHDGTSPLPLGMDASSTPLRSGANTVWPHDFRSGWSYSVTIPSWRTISQRKDADGNTINPTVFYRVEVRVQSPQGVSTNYGLLRRFSEFLKLSAALKRTFQEKKLPSAPPKNTLMRINSSQALLQERRRALQTWIESLLADIDISRSVPLATFLELEAAARCAVNTIADQQASSAVAVGSTNASPSSILAPTQNLGVDWTEAGSSVASSPYPSALSDATYDTPVTLTPSKTRDGVVELEMEALALEQEAAISGADDGFNYSKQQQVPQAIPRPPRGRIVAGDTQSIRPLDEDADSQQHTEGRAAEAYQTSATAMSSLRHALSSDSVASWHRRKGSQDSLASDIESVRGNDPTLVPFIDGNTEPWEEGLLETESVLKGVGAALPVDQRNKLRRVLMMMQRKISGAKADKEDLIARLNQETLVKEFLAIKVRDLEGELDNTRRKSREVLQQAVSTERDRLTNLQWELEESKNTLVNFEESSGLEKEIRSSLEDALMRAKATNEEAKNEIEGLKEKQVQLRRERDLIEAQARMEKKVLVKEIKSLRNAQPELRREMESIKQAKIDLEAILHEERQEQENSIALRASFLHEVEILRQRLLECNVDYLAREEERAPNKSVSGGTGALDLLSTSDSRIGLLLAEAQLLAQQSKEIPSSSSQLSNGVHSKDASSIRLDKPQDLHGSDAGKNLALNQIIIDLIIDNAQLQRAVNHSLTETALSSQRDDREIMDASMIRKSVLSKFLGTP